MLIKTSATSKQPQHMKLISVVKYNYLKFKSRVQSTFIDINFTVNLSETTA